MAGEHGAETVRLRMDCRAPPRPMQHARAAAAGGARGARSARRRLPIRPPRAGARAAGRLPRLRLSALSARRRRRSSSQPEAAAAPGSGVGGLAAAAGERRAITREILSLFVAFEAVCGDFWRAKKKKVDISALRAGSPRKPASLKGVPEFDGAGTIYNKIGYNLYTTKMTSDLSILR